jgi:hypothetical protein
VPIARAEICYVLSLGEDFSRATGEDEIVSFNVLNRLRVPVYLSLCPSCNA